ncbi:hypothetical protein ACFYUY_30725 [Kitasatospora sp. NPDC004745]|uniref:DUF7144 family membrane protein n=1 Tax=unclassified Kitasatospora TaxID=2633591 RepID=UPI0036B4A34B
MAATAPKWGPRPPISYSESDLAGSGLVVFAGVLLSLLALFNGLDGIAAIANSHVFIGDAHYVFGDLRIWGWVVLAVAAVQAAAAVGILVQRAQWARWTGVVALVVNAFVQMAFLPSYPLWSLTIIAVDVVGIYGLTAHGAPVAPPVADPGPPPPVAGAPRGDGGGV